MDSTSILISIINIENKGMNSSTGWTGDNTGISFGCQFSREHHCTSNIQIVAIALTSLVKDTFCLQLC